MGVSKAPYADIIYIRVHFIYFMNGDGKLKMFSYIYELAFPVYYLALLDMVIWRNGEISYKEIKYRSNDNDND